MFTLANLYLFQPTKPRLSTWSTAARRESIGPQGAVNASHAAPWIRLDSVGWFHNEMAFERNK